MCSHLAIVYKMELIVSLYHFADYKQKFLNRVIEFLNNILKRILMSKTLGGLLEIFKSKSYRLRFILFHWMVKYSNTHPLHKLHHYLQIVLLL